MTEDLFPSGWRVGSVNDDDGEMDGLESSPRSEPTTSATSPGVDVEVQNGGSHIAFTTTSSSSSSSSSSFTCYANRPIPRPETAGCTLYYFEVELLAAPAPGQGDGGGEEEEGGVQLGVGIGLARGGPEVQGWGVLLPSGVRVAEGTVPGETDGSISYFSRGTLRRGESGTGLEPALEVPYGSEFGASDRVGVGWDVRSGTVFFTCNGTMMGLAASEYGLDQGQQQGSRQYFPVIGVVPPPGSSSSSRAVVRLKCRFPLGFSSFRALALERCEALLKGRHFGWSMLMNNDELTAVVEGLVRRTGTPVEAFDRFIGSLDGSSNSKTELIGPDDVITSTDGEQQQAGVDTEAQLDQLSVGLKLLEALLQPPQEGGRRQRASKEEEEEDMAALDTHLVRSVMARCRSLQRSVGRRLERDMTATQGMEAAATAEGRLGRLLELNGQLNRILARMEEQKERGPMSSGSSSSSSSPPPAPNMFSLICTVRSGSRSEKFQAAVTLASLAQNDKCREEVLSAGGLHSLVHCMTTASSQGWPQVEYQSAKAIVRLVPAVKNLAHLVKYSQGILDALRIVLNRDPLETGSPQRSLSQPARLPDSQDQEERLSQRRLMVGSALAHLSATMQQEWSPSAIALFHSIAKQYHENSNTGKDQAAPHQATSGKAGAASRRPGSAAPSSSSSSSSLAWAPSSSPSHHRDAPPVDKPLEALVGLVVDLANSRPPPTARGEEAKAGALGLGMGEGSTATDDDSQGSSRAGAAGGAAARPSASSSGEVEVDEATILAAQAVSHLANCEGCRVLLVNYRVLPTLVSWLACSHKALQRHAACAVAGLCSRPERRSNGALSMMPDLPSSAYGLDVYTCGWIDAQILAEGGVTHLLPLAASSEAGVRLFVAKALDNLSIHPQNRGAIVSAGGIGSLVLLLNNALEVGQQEAGAREESAAIAEHAMASLFHLAMETETAGDVQESSCYLLAKEGGLYPLVACLQGPRGALRLSAVSTLAMMSQHAPVRLAIFQANALQPLLAIGYSVSCDYPADYPPTPTDTTARSSSASSASVAAMAQAQQRREEALLAKTEAIHVAYALANLAHTQDAHKHYERRMITQGAIPVLLHLCQCPTSIEVVHQAMRALARLCGSLVRGFLPSDMMSVPTPSGTVEKVRPVKSVEETHDEQLRLLQANEALRTVLHLLPSSNPYVQLEAVRALSVLARVDDFRQHIVHVALKDLLRLAVDSSGDRELRAVAQEALVSLGFEGGAKDLEFCGNDYSLLLHWFQMDRALEDQRMALREVHFALEAMMSDDAPMLVATATPSAMPPTAAYYHPHRLTASHQHSEGAGGKAGSGGLTGAVKEAVRRVVGGDGQGGEGRLRDLLLGTLQSVNCLSAADHGEDDDEYRLIGDVPVARTVATPTQYAPLSIVPPMAQQARQTSAGSSSSSTPTTRDTLLSFLGCGPTSTSRATSGASSGGRLGGDDDYSWGREGELLGAADGGMNGGGGGGGGAAMPTVRRRSSSSSSSSGLPLPPLPYSPYAGPLAVPEAGSVSFNLQKVLDRYFPSRLQQRELVPLTLYSGPDFRPMIRKPDFRALLMPSRRFFSFRREGRVVGRIVKKYGEECDLWALSFHDSSFEGEFCSSLLERLHLLPQVKSLSFFARAGHQEAAMETELAYLVGNLPVSVRHITFDGVLSRPALQILGVVLRTKASRSSSHKQSSPSLALTGLAVRNHTHLRPEDFTPLLDFLRKDSVERAGVVSQDSMSSEGPRAMGGGGGGSSASNLSGDGPSPPLSKGPSSDGGMAAPLSRSSSMLNYKGLTSLDLSGNRLTDWGGAEVVKAVTWCSSLLALDLSGNSLKAAALTLDALVGPTGLVAARDPWLHTLVLDDNSLSSRAAARLVSSLEQDRCLHTLSLANNGLADIKVAESFRRVLRSNRTLTDVNLSGNKLVAESGRQLLFGLLENPTLRFLRLSGNASLNGEERQVIERQLVNNRRHFFHLPSANGRASSTVGGGLSTSLTHTSIAHHPRAKQDPLASTVHPLLPTHQQASSMLGTALANEGGALKRICSCDRSPGWSGGHLSTCPDYIQTVEHHRAFSAPVAAEDLLLLQQQERRGGAQPLRPPRQQGGGESSLVLELQDEEDDDGWQQLKNGGGKVGFGEEANGAVDGKGPEAMQEGGEEAAVSDDAWTRGDVLSVLFSAPLAWRDVNGHLHAIEMLEFEMERELLVQSFREAGSQVLPTFDFATTERLRTAVTLGCRALHYSGHGHKNRLTFEDGNGGLQFVSLDLLQSLCGAGEHRLEFVFVSACFSRLAGQAFAEAGVAHVVCVNVDAQLADSAALAFTKAFYLALAVGSTVQNAFDIGKQAVAAAPNVVNSHVEGEKFLLLPEGQDHNVAVFAPRPVLGPPPRWQPPDSAWTAREHLPTPPEDFLGREVDMYRTINAVLNRRLITLLGSGGMGKSALAAGVVNYLALRKSLPDGIVMVRLQGKTTLEQLVQAIISAINRARLPEPSASERGEGGKAGGLQRDEEWLFQRLRQLKVLLVLDHIEELQASQDSLDLKVFLRQLFDQTRAVKVLVTSSRPVDIHTLPGIGVGETIVSVGPLTLRNTVRLFSRLCPHLHTARDRRRFLETLVTPDQADVTITSREITRVSLQLLERLGEGHPGRILQLAYEMSEKDVLALLQTAQQLHLLAASRGGGGAGGAMLPVTAQQIAPGTDGR